MRIEGINHDTYISIGGSDSSDRRSRLCVLGQVDVVLGLVEDGEVLVAADGNVNRHRCCLRRNTAVSSLNLELKNREQVKCIFTTNLIEVSANDTTLTMLQYKTKMLTLIWKRLSVVCRIYSFSFL